MKGKVRLRFDADAIPKMLLVRSDALAFRENLNSEIVRLENL